MDRGHRRLHEFQHDPDVVDHQIEHHSHLRAPRREGREPLGGDELRRADFLLEETHHGIEVLDVPDLDQSVVRLRRREHLLRLGQRRAKRFLDQQMAALREQRQCHRRMPIGRHHDRHRIAGLPEFLERRETAAAMARRDLGRTVGIRVVHPDQFGAGERRVNPGVVLAE